MVVFHAKFWSKYNLYVRVFEYPGGLKSQKIILKFLHA